VDSDVIYEIEVLYILHTSDISEETGINWISVSAIYRPYEGRMFKLGMVCLFVSLARRPSQSGPWPPHSRGFYITHNDAPQSVELLLTSYQLVAVTST